MRNLGVFLAQTVQTLKTAKQEDISEQYDDKRINTKLRVIDFDVVMTHTLPFTKFKDYIAETNPLI
jgi:hypothetical protein